MDASKKLPLALMTTAILFQFETAFSAPKCESIFLSKQPKNKISAEFEYYIDLNKQISNFLLSKEKITEKQKPAEVRALIDSMTEFVLANADKHPESTKKLAESFAALTSAAKKHRNFRNSIETRNYEILSLVLHPLNLGDASILDLYRKPQDKANSDTARTKSDQFVEKNLAPTEQLPRSAAETSHSKKIGFFNKLKVLFSSNKFSTSEITQKNPHFSEAQINFRRAIRLLSLKDHETVPSITFTTYRDAEHLIAEPTGQTIKKLTSIEEELLVDSQFNTNPHEVGSIIVYTNHSAYEIAALKGGATKIYVTANQIAKAVLNANSALNAGERITRVELTHVHPAYDIIVGEKTVLGSPLSEADISIAKDVSSKLGSVPFAIRAVVPNGYAYERTFQWGE